MIKFCEALIAYDRNSSRIKVGPLIKDTDPADWTDSYECTGGAAFTAIRELRGQKAKLASVALMLHLVRDHGVDFKAAFEAFDGIEEFHAATWAYWEALPEALRAG